MKKMICCLSLIVCLLASWAGAVPVSDKLIIHYRADALNLSNGADVLSWPDWASVDTSDGTANQLTGYGVPKFAAGVYNGLPAVQFISPANPYGSDLDKTLLQSNNWDWTTGDVCVFMVATFGKAGTNQRAMHIGKWNGAKEIDCDVRPDSPDSTLGSGVRFNNGYAVTNQAFTEGDWHISIREMAAGGLHTSLYYAVNGTTPLTVNTGSTTAAYNPDLTGNWVTLGDGQNTTGSWLLYEFYNGYIAEVLIYNKLMSADEKQQVYDFLFNKYHNFTAHNPSPVIGAQDQGSVNGSMVNVNLSWQTGVDPLNSTQPNPAIAEHKLYIGTEPNLHSATAIPLAAGVTTYSATLNPDTTYYWRVDEDEIPADPNVISGPVWSLKTLNLNPRIDVQPVNTIAFAGDPFSFDVTVFSQGTVTYEWHKSFDGTQNPATDPVVGTTATFSKTAALSDEGYYYCRVTNSLTGEAGAVLSNVVQLGIKREVAHWTLDWAAYVNGQHRDSTAGNHHIDPNNPEEITIEDFGPGADVTETGQGFNVAANPNMCGRTGSFATAKFTSEITVSAWVYWNGTNGQWQGIVCNRGSQDIDADTTVNYLFQVHTGGGVRFTVGNYAYLGNNIQATIGGWTHLAATAGPNGCKIYKDGALAGEATGPYVVPQAEVPVIVGSIRRYPVTGFSSPYNGVLDDVRIYNYEMDAYGIADLYNEISEGAVCLNPTALRMVFDVAGGGAAGDQPDCHVNMADFAALASDWLKCGLYPESGC